MKGSFYGQQITFFALVVSIRQSVEADTFFLSRRTQFSSGIQVGVVVVLVELVFLSPKRRVITAIYDLCVLRTCIASLENHRLEAGEGGKECTRGAKLNLISILDDTKNTPLVADV
jgi:hypothetical protein